MKEIGRPTEDEISRLEELAEENFVGEKWAIDALLWDDGDVHLEAFSTLGTKHHPGYPDNIVNHRQKILYKREGGVAVYKNQIEQPDEMHNAKQLRTLNEKQLEW